MIKIGKILRGKQNVKNDIRKTKIGLILIEKFKSLNSKWISDNFFQISEQIFLRKKVPIQKKPTNKETLHDRECQQNLIQKNVHKITKKNLNFNLN